MFCGNCGKQMPEGSGFCPSCGAGAGGGAPQPAATASAAGANATPSAAAVQRAKIEAQLKAGSQDAVEAVKVLALDPVGGLPKSFHLFSEDRALVVGAIFAGIYAVAMALAAARGVSMAPGMAMGIGGSNTASIIFKAFVGGLVFAAVIIGCFAGARMLFKGTGSLASDVYSAGTSLLPWALCLLIGTIFGPANFEIIMLVTLFALTYSILMLFTGFSKLASISEGKAALAVPVMLAVSFWLLTIVIRSMA